MKRVLPVDIAWLADTHACVTVCAGTLSEIPAAKAAYKINQSTLTIWQTSLQKCKKYHQIILID